MSNVSKPSRLFGILALAVLGVGALTGYLAPSSGSSLASLGLTSAAAPPSDAPADAAPSALSTPASSDSLPTYEPRGDHASGPELAFVYVGSSACGWSETPENFAVVRRLKAAVQREAEARGVSFSAIGVAKNWDVEDGVAHLAKAGPFDEIMTGRSWANAGMRHFVWGDIGGTPSTPQVLVVERRFITPDATDGPPTFAVEDEALLVKRSGVSDMEAWLERGTPIPDLTVTEEDA
jgi:hypothetical protein